MPALAQNDADVAAPTDAQEARREEGEIVVSGMRESLANSVSIKRNGRVFGAALRYRFGN